jgi:hypothetical protein
MQSRKLISSSTRSRLSRRISNCALYRIEGPLVIVEGTKDPSRGKLYVACDAQGDFTGARDRITRLARVARSSTPRSERDLGNICKLAECDVCDAASLRQAPAGGWLVIVSEVGELEFIRPPAGFVVYNSRKSDTVESTVRHLRDSVECGGQRQMCRSKTSHDAVSDTVPQYIGAHYFMGRVCPWKGGSGQDHKARDWRKTQSYRAQAEEDSFGALLPLSFFCMRRAGVSIGVDQGGRILTCQLVTSGFAAQDHVDNDLALYTLCSIYDDGEVRGGFQFGGWYVPLTSGHTFAFDGRVRHSMCGDACGPGGVRWSSAAFMSRNMAKTHGAKCTCRGCITSSIISD